MTTATPAPASSSPQRLAPWKWALGLLGFAAVIGASIWFGLSLRDRPLAAAAPSPVGAIFLFALGVTIFAVGAGLWGVGVGTAAMTFNFGKPFFAGFRHRLWVFNFVVGMLVQTGVALVSAPVTIPLLMRVLPSHVAVPAGILGPFVVAQLLSVWLCMWAPLPRVAIGRRLRARGLPPEYLALGRRVGTSDPGRNSFRRFGLVEDDWGMLWIGPDRLVYWGDVAAWELPHGRLTAVERKADAGSSAAYFGAVHVILHFTDETGMSHRLRLHPMDGWTMTALARELDIIGARLTAWHQTPTPGWVTGPQAFPLQPALSMRSGAS